MRRGSPSPRARLIAIVHLGVIVLAYTSPFWLDWRLVVLGTALAYLQWWLFHGCILTFAQFGSWNVSFKRHYTQMVLQRVGVVVEPHWLTLFFLVIVPTVIVLSSIFAQIGHGVRPWLRMDFL